MSTEFLLYVSVDIFYITTRMFSTTHKQLAVNSHLKILGFDNWYFFLTEHINIK